MECPCKAGEKAANFERVLREVAADINAYVAEQRKCPMSPFNDPDPIPPAELEAEAVAFQLVAMAAHI